LDGFSQSVYATNGSGGTITQIQMDNIYADGPSAAQAFNLTGVNGFQLTNSLIQGYGGNVYIFEALNSNGITLTGNAINDSNTSPSNCITFYVVANGTITGNQIGYKSTTGLPDSNSAVGIDIAGASNYIEISGNSVGSVTALQTSGLSPFPAHLVVYNNIGLDDNISTVGSSSSFAMPTNPIFKISGTTNITTVTGLWPGQHGTLITTSPLTFSAGATISTSCTTAAGGAYPYSSDGTLLYVSCGGSGGGGSGTVTSITISGTSGQIQVTGTCTSTTIVTCTINLPNTLVIPGTINGLTLTSSTGTVTIANGKTVSVGNTLTLNGTDSTTITFPNPASVTSGNCASLTKSGSTVGLVDAGVGPCIGGVNNTVTAGTGGVTQNYLAAKDTSNPTEYILPGVGGCGTGFAQGTVTVGNAFLLNSLAGTIQTGVADNAVTAGHLLIGGSATPGRVADSGQVSRSAIPSNVCIIGVAQANASTGANISLLYDGVGSYGTGGLGPCVNVAATSGTIYNPPLTACNSITIPGTGSTTITINMPTPAGNGSSDIPLYVVQSGTAATANAVTWGGVTYNAPAQPTTQAASAVTRYLFTYNVLTTSWDAIVTSYSCPALSAAQIYTAGSNGCLVGITPGTGVAAALAQNVSGTGGFCLTSGSSCGGGSSYPPAYPSAFDYDYLWNKFSSTTYGKFLWVANSNSGSTTAAPINGTTTTFGGISITTDGTTNHDANVSPTQGGTGTPDIINSGSAFTTQWVVNSPTSDANTQYRFGLVGGNDGGIIGALTDGGGQAGVWIDKQFADTTWFAVCENGSTATRTALGSISTSGTTAFQISQVSSGTYHVYQATTLAGLAGSTPVTLNSGNCPTSVATSIGIGVSSNTSAAKTINFYVFGVNVTGLSY